MNAEITDVLDHCIAEVRLGKTLEDTLRQYPNSADEIRPLLAIACKLHKLPGPAGSVGGFFSNNGQIVGSTNQHEDKR